MSGLGKVIELRELVIEKGQNSPHLDGSYVRNSYSSL